MHVSDKRLKKKIMSLKKKLMYALCGKFEQYQCVKQFFFFYLAYMVSIISSLCALPDFFLLL